MPRELKPCGTEAAARRHRKRGEKLDPACLAAENAARKARTKGGRPGKPLTTAEQREAAAIATALDIARMVEEEPEVTELDPIAEAKDNLREVRIAIKAALRSGNVQPIAQLSKRRQELTDYIATAKPGKQQRSLKDELADAREARAARRQAGA